MELPSGTQMLDLLVVKFIGGYGSKPIYFFGGAGLWSFGIGVLMWGIALAQKLFATDHLSVNRNPLVFVGILFFVAALQLFMMGLIAEMNMRIYYESQGKAPYVVAETKNLATASKAGVSNDRSLQVGTGEV